MKIQAFRLFAQGEIPCKAAKLFADELTLRMARAPLFVKEKAEANIVFLTDDRENKDSFTVEQQGDVFTLIASGIRGLVFAYALFLRKTEFKNGEAALVQEIAGTYAPDKRIRGHQIGYRTTPNTYDAWSYEDYGRYYLDLMYMFCNTVEHIPYEGLESRRNRLMKYDEEEFLVKATEMADELDLDVSLWWPNAEGETDESAAERRKKLLSTLARVDAIFPPGGDPGSLPADELVKRCQAIEEAAKTVFPTVEMWPSAQAPHEFENWGEALIDALKGKKEGIEGIITGPNHAFKMDDLRRKLPVEYPIRFYPDITHNVRCEYPVHFDRDDWHFALITGLGRECTNPRPMEFRRLHRLTRPYVCGSVSYSEGITDDVNKFIWSHMDFEPDCDIRESLSDYARLFFYGADVEKLADAILRLELDWTCDPGENPTIDTTFNIYNELKRDYPFLEQNWRFNQLRFRALCDWVLRYRRLFGKNLVKKANYCLANGRFAEAKAVLETPLPAAYQTVREEITALAATLFEQIGLQTDIEHYCADGWERGAVLEIIDLPVTDRAWLLNRFAYADTLPEEEREGFLKQLPNRTKVGQGEYYFSVAFNGLAETGVPVQEGEVYMNFRGDMPHVNNGSIPTCMFNIFDNPSFRLKTAGLEPGRDYILRVAFMDKTDERIPDHTVTVNGHTVYEGPQFGGTRNVKFEKDFMAPGFCCIEYRIPAAFIENGCVELLMKEKYMGIMFSELWFLKA